MYIFCGYHFGYNLCHHNSVIIYFCNLLCDQFLLSFYMLRSNLIIFMLSFFVTIFRHLPFPSIFLHFVQDTTDIFLGHLWRFVYVQFPSFSPSFSVNFSTPGLAMEHHPRRLSHTKCLCQYPFKIGNIYEKCNHFFSCLSPLNEAQVLNSIFNIIYLQMYTYLYLYVYCINTYACVVRRTIRSPLCSLW